MNLTPDQAKVLDFVIATQRVTGAPPTVREIAKHFGYASPNNASQHLRLIEAKGYLHRVHGKARGLTIHPQPDGRPEKGSHLRSVPIVGRIAAGVPLLAEESQAGHIALDSELFRGGDLMSLKIRGDSMEGAGIFDGDFAIIQRQSNVDHGEIAAVLLEDEATLKRVMKKSGRMILHAENPAYPDIILESTRHVTILGKLRGVVRVC